MSEPTPDSIIILIPSFNPTSLMIDTLNDLNSLPLTSGLKKVVVNDGSTEGERFFNEIAKQTNVTILNHKSNLGKGAAIKTGIKHVKYAEPLVNWVVTVDSDGQHKAQDVCSLIQNIIDNQLYAQIGVRRLSQSETPLRSYLGNLFMRNFFFFLYNFDLKDTQSGLRVYPRQAFDIMLALKSVRYEFEMDVITILLRKKFHFIQTPISTIYFNKNKSSHFKPVIDSLRVFWILIKNRFKIF